MILTGKQKAAMLLMSLDVATASELVKGLKAETIQDLALEVAYLENAGYRNSKESIDLVREFCGALKPSGGEYEMNGFVRDMLRNSVGDEKAKQIQNQIQNLLVKKDPFISIRSASVPMLAQILETEHPQAAAVVLGELPAKKSSELLNSLSEGVRISVIRRMAAAERVTSDARMRIAEAVFKRIELLSKPAENGETPAAAEQHKPEESLRKVAIILRNLSKELRDVLIDSIKQKSAESAAMVSNLMILWEDIPLIADKTLQNSLRGIDLGKLALAFIKSDEAVINKIKANISQRAQETIAEEASLLSSPKKEDIEAAREMILNILRELNQKGELQFAEQ